MLQSELESATILDKKTLSSGIRNSIAEIIRLVRNEEEGGNPKGLSYQVVQIKNDIAVHISREGSDYVSEVFVG